jgi:hypothetical protein
LIKIKKELTPEKAPNGTYDLKVTLDPLHKNSVYSSYVYFSSGGQLMKRNIFFAKDRFSLYLKNTFKQDEFLADITNFAKRDFPLSNSMIKTFYSNNKFSRYATP